MRDSTIERMAQGINMHPGGTGFVAVVLNTKIFRMTSLPGIDLNGALTATIKDSDVSSSTASGIQVRSTAQAFIANTSANGSPFGVFNSAGTPNTRLKDNLLIGTSTGAQNNAGTMTAFQSNVTNGTGGVIGSVAPQ
jgi:hypothetical protein